MIEFIKKNWLIAVISGATGSTVTVILIKHWFSKDMSDIVTNWITALSSLAVAVFAWMAYKYGKNVYIEQKKVDRIFQYSTNLVEQMLEPIYSLYNLLKPSSQLRRKLSANNLVLNQCNTDKDIKENNLCEKYNDLTYEIINARLLITSIRQQKEASLSKLVIVESTYKSIGLKDNGILQEVINKIEELENYLDNLNTQLKTMANQITGFSTTLSDRINFKETFNQYENIDVNELIDTINKLTSLINIV